jgi:hypothetical protein
MHGVKMALEKPVHVRMKNSIRPRGVLRFDHAVVLSLPKPDFAFPFELLAQAISFYSFYSACEHDKFPFFKADEPALPLARRRLWRGGQCSKQARAATKLQKVHPPNFAEITECRRNFFGESRCLRCFSAGEFLLFLHRVAPAAPSATKISLLTDYCSS